MEKAVYKEWVPAGLFVKVLVGFVSLLTLCVLLFLVAAGFIIQNMV